MSTESKGRPTPTRKEAEAAARERARLGTDRKALARRNREERIKRQREIREGHKAGKEAYLPARDQGPVRRFIRDFVDVRIGFAELATPMVVLYFITTFVSPVLAQGIMMALVLLIAADLIWLRFRVRRAVKARFPGESLKGVTYYAIVRSLNMRFLRLPKPQVKIGQELPAQYR